MALTGLGAQNSFRPKIKVSSATPTAPAATSPAPQPMQPDPVFMASIGAAQLGYNQQIQNNQYSRGQLGQTYGMGVTPQGGVFDDPSNPYSRAAAMQESYDNSKRGNTNSFAARGQLYAGSLQDAQNTSAENFDKGRDALIREFLGKQAALAQSDTAAGNALTIAATGAQADAIARAQANANAAPAALSAPADSQTSASPTASKPKSGYQFVQSSGSRAGLSYKLVQSGGKTYRFYENGDKVLRP